MLRRLTIRNLVLIREAELELEAGLIAITGETGAGKTILAQAIGLLLGAPSEQGLVGPDASEAYVEAELDLPDGLLDEEGFETLRELAPEDEPGVVIARRVFADGRSRAYAWGRAVPRDAVGALTERLIAMSGQFEQRRLARPAYQLELLDAFCGEEQLRARSEAATAWRRLRDAERELELAEGAEQATSVRRAELEHLLGATETLREGEHDELVAERERLRRAGDLVASTVEAVEAIAPEDGIGAADLAGRAGRALDRVAGVAGELDVARAALGRAELELREAASGLRGTLAALDAQPGRLEAVEEQLAELAELRRRFGAADTAELLALREAAAVELAAAGGDRLRHAHAAAERARAEHAALSAELRVRRHEAAGGFAVAASAELAALGLGNGELVVELAERAPGPSGADEVALSARPNDGLPSTPVASTASGGELSRIALALRTASHASAGEPTVVFDEIDAGIGGVTAHAVAESLLRLAARAQVLTITHLPQIASAARTHLFVEKVPGDPTHTRIHRLDDDEQRAELERMLGGAAFLEAVVPGRSRR